MYYDSDINDYYSIEPKSYRFIFGCIAISVLAHLGFLSYLQSIKQDCLNCQPNTAIKPLFISIKKPEAIKQETIKPESKVIEEPTNIKAVDENTTVPQDVPEIEQLVELQSRPEPSSIDYSALNASIASYIEDDAQSKMARWQENCAIQKQLSGKSDCIDIKDRFASKGADPYGLSSVFRALDNGPSTGKQKRLIEKLKSNQARLMSAASITGINDETRRGLLKEAENLRTDIIYSDCGGNLNSGTCAGEVDLLQAADLLIQVLSKL